MKSTLLIFLLYISSLGVFAQTKVSNTLIVGNVTVIHSQSEENTDKLISEVSVSPNPTHSDAKLEFNIGKSSKVDISLLNTIGKKIEHFTYSRDFFAGKHIIHLNTSELPQGLYFVEIVCNGVRTVQRLFVIAN